MGKTLMTVTIKQIKPRDPFRVGLIERKKGPHKDKRREENKNHCRKKVNEHD